MTARRPDDAAAPERHVGIMTPLVRSAKGLTDKALAASMQRLFPGLGPVRLTRSSGGFEAMWGRSGGPSGEGQVVNVTPVRSQIPGGLVEDGWHRNWMVLEGTPPPEYVAHLLVTAVDASSAVRAARAVTMVSAAIIDAGDISGVYCAWAGCTHAPEVFLDMAKAGGDGLEAEDFPPIMLWVNVIVSAERAGGPLSASTNGLEQFGHPELEVVNARWTLGELRSFMIDMAGYLISSGMRFEHGQTCGHSAEQRFKIEVGRSKLGLEGTVARINVR